MIIRLRGVLNEAEAHINAHQTHVQEISDLGKSNWKPEEKNNLDAYFKKNSELL